MKKKIISFFKLYSNFVFPTLICLVCHLVKSKTDIFLLDTDKVSALISVSSSFIGVLLTILTIYLAVPKNAIRIKQLKESKHQYIYFANLLTGIALSFVSILAWIFFDSSYIASVAFLASISNMLITIYYTFSLVKIMEN